MERICKNCGSIVYAQKKYCADCGAKWISNRITMRSVFSDFADMYIGIDTRFVRTVLDLFKKPEDVIDGFISGRRMGYVDAIRYLFISLFFTGIMIFGMKQLNITMYDIDQLVAIYSGFGFTEEEALKQAEGVSRFSGFMQNYMSIIVLISIPIYALWGRITFWSKKRYYNYTEQIVVQLYTYSQYAICTAPFSIVILYVAPKSYSTYTAFLVAILFLYNAYVYKRLFKLTAGETILRSLKFIAVTIITYLGLVIIGILCVLVFLIASKIIGG